jgi:hypothetical protein
MLAWVGGWHAACVAVVLERCWHVVLRVVLT